MLLLQTAFALETVAIERAGEPLGQVDGLAGIQVAGKRCAVLQTGIGPGAAQRALGQLLDRIEAPQCVISIGLAGSLVPTLKFGDWALIERVCRVGNPAILHSWLGEGEDQPSRLSGTFFDSARRAPLVTIDRIAFTPAQKCDLLQQAPAQLCDMETYVVAQQCQQRQIPWLGARVVSDAFDEELKEWTTLLPGLLAKKRYLRFFKLLATHPQDLPSLVRLGFRMRLVRQQLTQLTRDLVTHVPAA